MELRLVGTVDECADVVAALRAALDVREVSKPYANRGASKLVRVYVNAVPRPPALFVGQVLTATSPEPPPGSIARSAAGEIWERHPDGGSCSWFRIDDDGRPFGNPESWTTVAGKFGPVFLDHIEDGKVTT